MILLVHMLFGAVFGTIIKNPILAIFLALLGHYFLDIFPHIEYSISNIRNKNWRESLPDWLKVVLDFLLGLLIIFLFSKNNPLIYICGFVALIPDALTIISDLFPNRLLHIHDIIHTQKIHYLTKQKNFPVFWKIFSQVLVTVISIILL